MIGTYNYRFALTRTSCYLLGGRACWAAQGLEGFCSRLYLLYGGIGGVRLPASARVAFYEASGASYRGSAHHHLYQQIQFLTFGLRACQKCDIE